MKAALYTRVSTTGQAEDGFSLDAQIKALREYCFKNAIEVFGEYIDEGISGTKEDRPQFQKMINDAKNFDVILVHKFDRFARKIELSHRIKAKLKTSKCNVISITEPIEDSPIGFFQEGLLELLAEYYVRNLSKEVKKGHIERASQGLYNGSLPYGYSAINGKLVINQSEAEIVRLIYEMYLEGMSCQKIAFYLQENRILTQKQKQFKYFQVWRILQNPKYIGMIEYDGQLYEGQHEPIISKKDFDEARRELTNRNVNPNKGRGVQRNVSYYKYHLLDILYCGECKCRMRIRYSTGTSGNKNSFTYVCNRYLRYDGSCDNRKAYKPKVLEADIDEILEGYMKGKTNINNSSSSPTPDLLTEQRKNKITTELDRAKAAYLAGVFDLTEYTEIKKKLTIELKQIKSTSNNKANSKKNIKNKIKSIWSLYQQEQDVCKKRSILKSIIEKIYISPTGAVTIEFR